MVVPMVLVASLGLAVSDPIRLTPVHVVGEVQPATRTVDGTITTAVRTPLGNVPVTGHVQAYYRCDATFSGTVRYSPVIRFLARLRGATLVNTMDGRMEAREPWDCRTGRGRFAGRFTFADTVMKGHLLHRGDSIPVDGFAWVRGERQFQSRLMVRHAAGGYTLHVSLAER
jgi:hypothetical protein